MTVKRFDHELSTMMLVSSEKRLEPRLALALGGDHLGQPHGAGKRLLDEVADAPGAALLVGLVVELAGDEDRVERLAVGGGVDLRVDDVGAGNGAGAGDHRQEPRMIRGEHRDLGDRLEGAAGDAGGERAACRVGLADEVRVGDLARQVDAQPIGRDSGG